MNSFHLSKCFTTWRLNAGPTIVVFICYMNRNDSQEDEDYRFGLDRNYQPGTDDYEDLSDYCQNAT